MSGPVLPVESSNKYVPMDEPKVESDKFMAPPTFRGINIERNNQVWRWGWFIQELMSSTKISEAELLYAEIKASDWTFQVKWLF